MSPAVAGPAIRSRSNPLIRTLRQLASQSSARDRDGTFVADGVRLVEEALRAGLPIRAALASERLRRTPRGRRLEAALARSAEHFHRAADSALEAVIGAPRHQGVVVQLPHPAHRPAAVVEGATGGIVVVACGVQDPGNLGGILRVAAAAGASGMLALEGSADPWNPKAVRASAGAIFRVPVSRAVGAEAMDLLARRGFVRVGASPRGGLPFTEAPWDGSLALLLGAEGEGLPEDLRTRVDRTVSVPMAGGVESLNVLAAATLLLYEAARQRGQFGRGDGARRQDGEDSHIR